MKVCTKCKEPKLEGEFTKDRAKSDGLCSWCKTCSGAEKRRYFQANRQKLLDRNKAVRDANPEKERARRRANRAKNREQLRRWRAANPEKTNAWARNYRKKRMHDPVFKVSMMLRNRLLQTMRYNKTGRCAKTEEMLGCSFEEFTTYIERQFLPGMTWGNHGVWKCGEPMKWHIDHILPCRSFDLTDPDQQRKCFHYSNLQPLWAIDNLTKNAVR